MEVVVLMTIVDDLLLFFFRSIADMMMPDGAEKQQYDSIVFFLNRNEVRLSYR